MYNVFSTLPSRRAKKTTSNVVFPFGGTACKVDKKRFNEARQRSHQTMRLLRIYIDPNQSTTCQSLFLLLRNSLLN